MKIPFSRRAQWLTKPQPDRLRITPRKKNYFNQINRDVEIIIPKDTIDTYDSEEHNKNEYAHASDLLMEQSGIKLVKSIKNI